MIIDTTYDYREDARSRNGLTRDPDKYSKKLKQSHQLLWSKALPNGGSLNLDENLVNQTDIGDIPFASDSIIPTFSYWKNYNHIISQIPKEDIEHFDALSHTIAGTIIFPLAGGEKKTTFNQDRGTNKSVKDRFDLTLECIRLYYLGESSPLYESCLKYKPFFDLFVTFQGYVEFFLLQDLVDEKCMSVKFFLPFEQFGKHTLPESIEEYYVYMKNSLSFIEKRNQRIAQWAINEMK